MVQQVIRFLALLTLFSNFAIVLFFLSTIVKKDKLVKKFISKYSLQLIFIVSATATLGSLFLSEIAHFEPCKLCWYQRIFMYPIPILSGLAIYLKDKNIWKYVLPLSVIGASIALYHYYIQFNPEGVVPCSTVGISVSCTERQFTHFGYITIPFMSLTAFVMISIFSLLRVNLQHASKK